MQRIAILLFLACLVFLICLSIGFLYRDNILINKNNNKKVKGFVNKMNNNDFVSKFSKSLPNSNIVKIFNRSKNPWRMTIPTFQFVRYFGLILGIFLSLSLLVFGLEYSLFSLFIGILCFWYPMYYYKAIGDEREAEWNKTYEFIWVIKHNLMLYDPAKAFNNTKIYIQEHAPHNKEIIQGFSDFYKYWDSEKIDPYIERFYPFSITREIYQIVFNMNKTGEFPEDSLNALRSFIINAQNLSVEKTLSSISGKATIYSLPFLMISVIVSLMVPLIFQIVKFF